MQSQLFELVCLVLIILALVMLARRLRVAYPIVLVLGGLGLSFTAGFANIAIDPDLVFYLFLPPLLYEAAWQTSWKEFWRWRRIITGFAFPIVILTSCVVAVVSQALIPGFTLALGFLLGGIISPPDAISATTIMRQVKVPKVLVSVIEGESLLNDASSLIVLRFALAAVLTGQFHLGEATTSFFLVIVLGTLIGLLVGLVFYAIHRWLPTTPSIEIVLTLVTPYCMYFAAEHFHYSGVLAVVSGGLLLSSRRDTLLSSQSRLQAFNVWAVLSFVLNGLVFLLIGLQLPIITAQLGSISLSSAIGYGLLISLALIVTRLLFALGTAQFTRLASHFITVADPNPGWKAPLIVGWAGMRGVVSLAAALSVPLLTPAGQPFPYRNLILFVTFVVILVTLVFQGLTLPWLIRKLQPQDHNATLSEPEQERVIQQQLTRQALQFVEERFGPDGAANDYLHNLRARLQLDMTIYGQEHAADSAPAENELTRFQRLYVELLAGQRQLLHALNQQPDYDEELIRKYLSLTDLEELKLREKLPQAADAP
ncbi:Na+/H+ antiporter [Hymenobacter sp. CRA2]|uniref:Na+/H+ antiporter n=1 Tax=Hymenobacter sp. CRA2 TaxID=1955620 RepID=UPI00098F09F0|nr:Na+/H+ antiporter [Hymenobacter sp. CRA2]OON68728.1 Na+/H+ antiporter [Hymenobacter sp. CRA2]